MRHAFRSTITISLWLGAGCLAILAGCSRDKPTAEPAPVATMEPAHAAPSASALPAPIAASAAVAAPSASAAVANVTRSARPTPREWCEAPIARLGYEGYEDGDTVEACKMLEVREWVMIWCPASGRREGGKNLGVYERALPGGGSMATEDERAAGTGVEYGAPDAILVSLRPGTKAKPTFTYRPNEHPEWLKDDSFTLELPEGAMNLSDHLFNGHAWPRFEKRDTTRCEQQAAALKASVDAESEAKTKAQLAEDARGVPDVEGIAAAPTEEAWLAEKKEALVSGSGAIGCKTKVIEPWFWMRCEGKTKMLTLEVEKGRRATQTKASVAEGTAALLTPFVEGTDLRAKLTYEGGERFLKLRWLKGKRPFQVGTVVETR
jgi:hypothetical protein